VDPAFRQAAGRLSGRAVAALDPVAISGAAARRHRRHRPADASAGTGVSYFGSSRTIEANFNSPTLAVKAVSKTFSGLKAVDDVSFSLNPGERVALLGHNGAGKTTLFKIVLGFLKRDRGDISVLGAVPGSHAARAGTAYLPESVAFPASLSGKEVLTFYARLKGESPASALPLLDRVGLADAAKRRVGTYSKGMLQRLGLAQALIGRPRLILLDEPTTGLDPISRQNVYELIGEIAGNGTTVLLSSHALTELEARTDRILILSKGKLVADDILSRLRAQAGQPPLSRAFPTLHA
jgi:Cu-processing system ATP-binding protein